MGGGCSLYHKEEMENCGPTVQMSKLTLAGPERTWTCPEEWVFAECQGGQSKLQGQGLEGSLQRIPNLATVIPGPVQPLRAQADLCSSAPSGMPFSPSSRQLPLPPRRLPPCLQAGKPVCGLPRLYPACDPGSFSVFQRLQWDTLYHQTLHRPVSL